MTYQLGKTDGVLNQHSIPRSIYGESANAYRKSTYDGYTQKQRFSVPPFSR